MNWIQIVSKLGGALWSAFKAYKFLNETGLLKRAIDWVKSKKR